MSEQQPGQNWQQQEQELALLDLSVVIENYQQHSCNTQKGPKGNPKLHLNDKKLIRCTSEQQIS